MKILGFSAEGLPILPTTHFSGEIDVIRREKLGWDEISRQSAKVVSFIGRKLVLYFYVVITLLGQILLDMSDILKQHYMVRKAFKSMVSSHLSIGLTSGSPSLVLLMVAANAGLIGMSKEHLAIALALNVPVAVCITKVK